MDFLPQAFSAMATYPQFIPFQLTPSKTRTGKYDKLPVDHRTGIIANAHNPDIWTDHGTAITAAKRLGRNYGVGFVFTEKDPFFFLDIDDCLQPCGTAWSPLAVQLLSAFSGAAVEVSSSGRGLHVIGCGSVGSSGHRNSSHKIEFYTQGRFVALTGTHAQGNAGLDYTPQAQWLIENYFPKAAAVDESTWTEESCAQWRGPTDDATLIARALHSQSGRAAFGNSASFRDLWDANAEVLAKAYPDPARACGYNESSADAALAQHLAWWTGNNCQRIRGLMLQSKLVREKWNREGYLRLTILSACSRQTQWICDTIPEPIGNVVSSQDAMVKPQHRTGATYLDADAQANLFAGCYYVADEHKILIPGGYLLNHERFRTVYGGYSFPVDKENTKVTRNAWEAFTESQIIISPRVHSTCFKPDLKPAEVIEQDGQRLVNVWWPVTTPRMKGDPQLMLDHIKLLCPDERDQMILICYMAALIQHKGVKFQWCPLIQGVEGNGKTLLTRAVAFAIGNKYTHFPKAAEIANKFNDWLYAKLFIGVEDIFVYDGRQEIMESLKPMITSDRQEIEPKGGAKITRDVCANFIINTNHKDGLRKNRNDRRFAPFYTAQQSVEDLYKCGMDGAYFSNLYGWAFKMGFSIFNDFLQSFIIPDEFNPATLCKRAPTTSSTESAIDHGTGGLQQEILEQISQGAPGFRGGWVSSMAFDKLLEKLGMSRRIPHNKRRDLLKDLGYIWHPGLKDGRVNNPVLPDGGKPRLYITEDHPTRNMDYATDIARAYSEAQKPESS